MRYIHIVACITLLAAFGCKKDARSLETKEERNPLIKQGQAYMEIRDYNKAEAAFKQAIGQDPRMARPYLDLATIYHQYKPDYISAIFYYKRYLELRPDSEKTEFIREQIVKVQNALVETILTRSGAMQAIEDLKTLQQENAELKRQLAALSQGVPQQTESKSVTETIPKSSKPSTDDQPSHQIYTVVDNDNLTKIAIKFYGVGDYEPIYEANKDRMSSPNDLRAGQTLIIPNRD